MIRDNVVVKVNDLGPGGWQLSEVERRYVVALEVMSTAGFPEGARGERLLDVSLEATKG